MKTKLGLAALIAAAAMIAMPVNSAEAFHGWHKRHCAFKWTHCYCKRKAVKKYYKKRSGKKGKKGGKAK